ncbi:hypothetical protein EXU85_03680 [Spirosoma sp. KCTC 42546]|uniref:hypothetical protein n=1 Tax=Spirosoma sp. KCTC 42546 TaxID=2520506 RepID=UPI001156E3B4|nr:hypothetical protein [Spirosoma sp. KCTC 42546]QDK77743.1 hypothetical protein EXU85_03680 [Spirosoma sp. KCTC 42546]
MISLSNKNLLYVILVLLFGLFPYHQDITKQQNTIWYNYLPNCPCKNPDSTGVYVNDGWAKDKGNITKYHRGAAECFRSYPPIETSEGKSGQQCCYDKSNNLITEGSGAGTPDKESTCSGENSKGVMITRLIGIIGHYRKDVKPWDDMGGENNGWVKYNQLWKPNQGKNCKY